ncbi:hypothetical protein ABEX78_21495 [Priestia megaterium]
MKKVYLGLISLFLLVIATACSVTEHTESKEHIDNIKHLKLQKTDVMITDDKKLVGEMTVSDGKNKNKQIVPTDLYYTFTIKNTSNNDISLPGVEKVKLRIEPDKDLLSVVKETIGTNIYDVDKSGLGFGLSMDKEIPSKKLSKFTLNYTLGAKQKNVQLPLLPTKEKLKKVQANALKGTLIISQDGKDVARFRLDKTE